MTTDDLVMWWAMEDTLFSFIVMIFSNNESDLVGYHTYMVNILYISFNFIYCFQEATKGYKAYNACLLHHPNEQHSAFNKHRWI